MSDKYTDFYDYEWNLNVTITKSLVNKRCKIYVDTNSVARVPVR